MRAAAGPLRILEMGLRPARAVARTIDSRPADGERDRAAVLQRVRAWRGTQGVDGERRLAVLRGIEAGREPSGFCGK